MTFRQSEVQYNMLMTIIEDALMLVASAATGRQRLRDNLHIFATAGMFPTATKEQAEKYGNPWLKNEALLLMLQDSNDPDHAVGRETKSARHLRSKKSRRTLKINTIREIAVKLLKHGAETKADVVRGWVAALIFESARRTHLAVGNRSEDSDIMELRSLPYEKARPILTQCSQILMQLAISYMDASEDGALRRHHDDLVFKEFLDASALMLIEAMDRQVHIAEALHNLLDSVYPEFNKYDFASEE